MSKIYTEGGPCPQCHEPILVCDCNLKFDGGLGLLQGITDSNLEESKIDSLFAALDLERPLDFDPMEALRLGINRLRGVERQWSEACEIARAHCPVGDGESYIRNGIPRLAAKACGLLEEIEKWKDSTGLERGGDPDGVTPDDLRAEIAHLRATQEKSWSAADETLCARYEAVIRDLMDACDMLMGDSDLPDDDSPEMKAMRRAASILKKGGK